VKNGRSTSLAVSAKSALRGWSMSSGRNRFYFATKTTKADGFGTWSSIG